VARSQPAPRTFKSVGARAGVVSLALGAGLFLAALNLRPAIASISPLLDVIRSQVYLSHTLAGLLTTIPTLCIGVGAFLVPPLAARIGPERALTAALVVIGLATLARAWVGDAATLFITTLLVGAGIAIGQTLLPGLVRRHFAEHRLLITSLYSLGITLGAAIPAAATAPLQEATGSWKLALAFWALFAAAAVAVIAPVARRTGPSGGGALVTPPWRDVRAWQIALFFGGASGLYFVILAWFAPIYEDHGFSPTRAGLLLTLLSVAQAAATVLLTWRAQRVHDRRPILVGALAVLVIGMFAVALAPFSAPVLWALLLGIGNGIVFPAMLVLPVDYAPDHETAARLAGMGFGVGYLLASLGPVVTGGLRELTGSYAAPFATYGVVCLLLMALATRFAPNVQVEQEVP
jgi:CP family cyanate transporter-like MFS transporter